MSELLIFLIVLLSFIALYPLLIFLFYGVIRLMFGRKFLALHFFGVDLSEVEDNETK